MSVPGPVSGRAWGWGLGLLLLLLGAAGVLLFSPPPESGPPEVPAAAPARPVPAPAATLERVEPRARVVEVVGEAQRAHGEAWVGLRVGDALEPDDSVRTGTGGRVDVWVGDESSRLSIPEGSEVRVGGLTRALHSLRLERGRIDVDYRGGEPRVLRVQGRDGAVAETREARFTLLRRGTLVAVVTRGGSVDLSSAGASIQVGAGQQGLAFDGARPIGPQPIPLDVLLKVARAVPGHTLCLSLAGKVRLGTEVWVDDEAVEVSPEGSFRVDVPRAPGRSRVKVLARELGGASREVSLACRSTRAGSVRFRWDEAP